VVVGFVTGFANNQPTTYTHHQTSFLHRHQCTSLYAKKNKKKPKRAAQTTKGFGAPPPKLEDVLATFKSRLPENAGESFMYLFCSYLVSLCNRNSIYQSYYPSRSLDEQPCACGSGKVYGDCCGPLHSGEKSCLTMTDVLRSRYTAFSYRNIKYVLDTTHESCRDYREDKVAWAKDLDKGGMFDSFEFVKLQAGEEEMSKDDENCGYVEFKVTLRAKEDKYDTVAGQETVISERSRFLRNLEDGSWSYASGDVRSDVVGLEDTQLNA